MVMSGRRVQSASAPRPLATTIPASTGLKPSGIPSQTQSVPAFLPGPGSVGPRGFGHVALCREHSTQLVAVWNGFQSQVTSKMLKTPASLMKAKVEAKGKRIPTQPYPRRSPMHLRPPPEIERQGRAGVVFSMSRRLEHERVFQYPPCAIPFKRWSES